MKNIVDITIFLIIQFIFIVIVLIYLYQGGSISHPNARCFVFYENYLNDLGRYNYYNGGINPFSIFFTISLTMVGIGTGSFFYIISKFCHQRSYFPLIFGAISGAGLIGLSVFWSDITHDKHLFFGRLAYLSFFIATLGLNYCLKKQSFPRIYNLLLALNILLFLFLILMFLIDSHIFHLNSEEKLHLTSVLQKFIIAVRMFVVINILLILKKLNNRINIL